MPGLYGPTGGGPPAGVTTFFSAAASASVNSINRIVGSRITVQITSRAHRRKVRAPLPPLPRPTHRYPSRKDFAGSMVAARYIGNRLAKIAVATRKAGAAEKLAG